MKKLILALAIIAGAWTANAADKDTVAIDFTKVQKLIEDETTNKKGKKVMKYYLMYNGELVPTSKNVVERYRLCKKHGAKCRLAMVVNRENKHKRVILN